MSSEFLRSTRTRVLTLGTQCSSPPLSRFRNAIYHQEPVTMTTTSRYRQPFTRLRTSQLPLLDSGTFHKLYTHHSRACCDSQPLCQAHPPFSASQPSSANVSTRGIRFDSPRLHPTLHPVPHISPTLFSLLIHWGLSPTQSKEARSPGYRFALGYLGREVDAEWIFDGLCGRISGWVEARNVVWFYVP